MFSRLSALRPYGQIRPLSKWIQQAKDTYIKMSGENPELSITQLWKREKGDHTPTTPISKKMVDSFFLVEFPFSTDLKLRESYVSFTGNTRIGKVLEHLDGLAGRIGYVHCSQDHRIPNITIVTACVDRILLLQKISIERDLRMSGHVSWVGKTSMEVSLIVETKKENEWETALITNFVMAARDPVTKKAIVVNRLEAETEEEKRLLHRGEELSKIRHIDSQRSLSSYPPTEEESKIIHSLFLDKNKQDFVNLGDTTLEWTKICHPQERNIHNKIFGGYLMREAFDLSFACATLYSKSIPMFISQDNIQFRESVEIGSILNLKAQVVYGLGEPHRSFQVSVRADVVDVSGRSKTTNTFHFTYFNPNGGLRKVIPQTYAESMDYLEGRRQNMRSVELKNMLQKRFDRWVIDPENYVN